LAHNYIIADTLAPLSEQIPLLAFTGCAAADAEALPDLPGDEMRWAICHGRKLAAASCVSAKRRERSPLRLNRPA
jgi:hypothetical protein